MVGNLEVVVGQCLNIGIKIIGAVDRKGVGTNALVLVKLCSRFEGLVVRGIVVGTGFSCQRKAFDRCRPLQLSRRRDVGGIVLDKRFAVKPTLRTVVVLVSVSTIALLACNDRSLANSITDDAVNAS